MKDYVFQDILFKRLIFFTKVLSEMSIIYDTNTTLLR